MSRIFLACFVSVVSLHCYWFKAQAWWSMGHRAIGYIAEKELALEPTLKKALLALLQVKTEDFTIKADPTKFNNIVDATVWLDFARHKDKKNLFRCHFIDIPFTEEDLKKPESFDEKTILNQIAEVRRNSPDMLNIIDCSEKALLTLTLYFASPSKETEVQAAIALRYLLHLVGDIHQPVHAAGLLLSQGKNDEGGNKLLFENPLEVDTYKGTPSKVQNFHMLLDAGLGLFPQEDFETIWVQDEKRSKFLEDFYQDLAANQSQPYELKENNFTQWILESHVAAKKIFYSDLTIKKPKNTTDPYFLEFKGGFESYRRSRRDFVLHQIWIAGKRLGWLLKSVYKAKGAHPFIQGMGPDIY